MSGYLADTSVFIAAEQRRPLGEPPAGDARVSVATLTELIVGVRRSGDGPLRHLREATLAPARGFVALPYDELVAERLAGLLSAAREQGRHAGRWTPSSPRLRWCTTSRCGARMTTSTCLHGSPRTSACIVADSR